MPPKHRPYRRGYDYLVNPTYEQFIAAHHPSNRRNLARDPRARRLREREERIERRRRERERILRNRVESVWPSGHASFPRRGTSFLPGYPVYHVPGINIPSFLRYVRRRGMRAVFSSIQVDSKYVFSTPAGLIESFDFNPVRWNRPIDE